MKPEQIIDSYLHQIIDETHPLFKAISDEEIVEDHPQEPFYTVYQRKFLHRNGKKFLMKWKVYDGTPETVKTVFEPAEQIFT